MKVLAKLVLLCVAVAAGVLRPQTQVHPNSSPSNRRLATHHPQTKQVGLFRNPTDTTKSSKRTFPKLSHFVLSKSSHSHSPSKKAKIAPKNKKGIARKVERRLNDGHDAHTSKSQASHGHKGVAPPEEEYELPDESVMKARINYPDLGLVNLEKGTYLFKIT